LKHFLRNDREIKSNTNNKMFSPRAMNTLIEVPGAPIKKQSHILNSDFKIRKLVFEFQEEKTEETEIIKEISFEKCLIQNLEAYHKRIGIL
jgi:hypothetical protein